MDGSPYRAPQVDVYQAVLDPASDREKLRKVASRQRAMLFALLANILAPILTLVVAGQAPLLGFSLVLLQFGAMIYAVIAIFRLAMVVYGTILAVVFAIFAVVPFLSLLLLLMVNQRATAYLQSHGIKVGFMGVDPNLI